MLVKEGTTGRLGKLIELIVPKEGATNVGDVNVAIVLTSVKSTFTPAGGGGGYTQLGGGAVAFGTGGTGGGQPGNTPCGCRNGTVNTGGGAGNSYSGGGGTGGSGIVIVRAPSAVTFAVSPGTNTVATCVGPSNDTVATFTVSGTNTLTVT